MAITAPGPKFCSGRLDTSDFIERVRDCYLPFEMAGSKPFEHGKVTLPLLTTLALLTQTASNNSKSQACPHTRCTC
jgi:hypothetical protein